MCYTEYFVLLALKFYADKVVPHQPFLASETRDTGLPDGEDRIPLRSFVLTQYRRVTDRRTDGFAVAYIQRLQSCALRNAVKRFENAILFVFSRITARLTLRERYFIDWYILDLFY